MPSRGTQTETSYPSQGSQALGCRARPEGRALPYAGKVSHPKAKPKTSVFIDGFNLYYGCYRWPAPSHWKKYKWLDLEKLCDLLLPLNHVVAIKYYTADVRNRPPDGQQSERQQAYLKALSTLQRVQIVKGHFLGPRVVWMQQCDPSGKPLGQSVAVLKTEEKGSDVNLAVDLLHDAVRDLYECAVIISNDSDLASAIRIARDEYGKTTGIVNPQRGRPSLRLSGLAHFHRRLNENLLSRSQLPAQVPIGRGFIRRPPEWS